ncbi:MAG: hypothetical protein ACM3JP_02480 [Betaproteobacteria bacterium]
MHGAATHGFDGAPGLVHLPGRHVVGAVANAAVIAFYALRANHPERRDACGAEA